MMLKPRVVMVRRVFLVAMLFFSTASVFPGVRRPPVTLGDNYMIGYGSLMQKQSRLRTAPCAKTALPVEVSGFQRVFGLRGSASYPTTFLAVKQSPQSTMNAVAFAVSADEIKNMDRRERGYDRIKVPATALECFSQKKSFRDSDVWIYANPRNRPMQKATRRFPLTQSYVDLFLSGCFQLQEEYKLKDFARKCVTSTQGWPRPAAWVNDRVHARRPFEKPFANKIDRLLRDSPKILHYTRHRIE